MSTHGNTCPPSPPARPPARLGRLPARQQDASQPLASLVSGTTEISQEQFKELLAKIDKGLRALPATAQVTGAPRRADGLALCLV